MCETPKITRRERHLRNALKKLKFNWYWSKTNNEMIFCGYLVPMEILVLYGVGTKFCKSNYWDLEEVEISKSCGESGGRTCDVILPEMLLSRIDSREVAKKNFYQEHKQEVDTRGYLW